MAIAIQLSDPLFFCEKYLLFFSVSLQQIQNDQYHCQ